MAAVSAILFSVCRSVCTAHLSAPSSKQILRERERKMLCSSALLQLGGLPSTCEPDIWARIQVRVQTEARRNGGTVLVIGANTGPGPGRVQGGTQVRGSDPVFEWLAGSQADALDKVLVEPMPHIVPALRHNIRSMPRARVVMAAVAEANGQLPMFCLGADNSNATTSTGVLRLSALARRASVPDWVAGTCSLSRERLFSTQDFCARNRHRLVVVLLVQCVAGA